MMKTTQKTDIHPLRSCRSTVAMAAITVALQACGGGGGDGDGGTDANGLLPGLEPCAFLLDLGIPAETINAGGSCVFTQEDGSTGFASVGEDPVDGDPLNPDIPGVGVPNDGDTNVAISNPDLLSGDVPRNPALADVAGSSFFPDPNNAAILSGAVIGDNSIDNSMLTRSLPFEVGSIPNELSVEHVYATRAGDALTEVIALVRNVSSVAQCFVDIRDMFILDRSGNRVDPFLFAIAFVDGTTYQFDSGTVTNTCLDSGQIGYVRETFFIDLDDVQAVNAGAVDLFGPGTFSKSATPVLPVSYEVLPDGDIEVTVVNQGLMAVETSSANIFILDNDGFPLGADFASTSTILNPGAETTIVFDTAQFSGSATSIRALIDWNLPE